MHSQEPILRIGEVSRRTGTAVSTLRAWERRYELLMPHRTEGGHRLYSDADVERVRAMQALLDEGWSAAAAAREVQREAAPVTRLSPLPGGDPSADLVDRLERAFDTFDAGAADTTLDDAFARFEVPAVLDHVLVPAVVWAGNGWQDDPRAIAREHFATNVLRPRLLRLLRASASISGRSCLAATPEGEQHDLGLLMASAVATSAGWRVHFLGAQTPAAALERAAAELRPAVVLVAAVDRAVGERFCADPPALADAGLVLGGAGFVPEDAERLPRAVVHQGSYADIPATLLRGANGRRAG